MSLPKDRQNLCRAKTSVNKGETPKINWGKLFAVHHGQGANFLLKNPGVPLNQYRKVQQLNRLVGIGH